MNSKLYVGNLSYSATDQQLSDHFAQAGTVVSAIIISDRQTGRSKGFGFVEMSTPEEAQKAIEMFNGQDFGGRSIVVNEARPKVDQPRGGTMSRPTQEPQITKDEPMEEPKDASEDESKDMAEDISEETPEESKEETKKETDSE